ncbi:MAG: hypothetical protein A2008_12620 [Candidatus Wallbacteria bacterium GWC2_49_35]|uniref:RNA helicase n=1 Tax=Candidatus Wallbacteria bacterium GWC2_49_35 TaxID=1817813 RepID=A0A1F7WSA6_9BACT|nr:MAG: hypothetical protein A2008_12620 [Candidatus Wallbacteria bacterium GWC2_49_35]
MNKLKFTELNISEKIQRAAADMGFEEASPIQAETIPILLAGRDLIGQAQTGTGKTAAFAIPILEKIDHETKELQALVLCPTRELVIQVTEEFRRLTKYFFNLAIVPVYGGQEIDRQIDALKRKPQIVVGTPGRLMDHMRRATIKLDKLRFVVLDEADEMLDMGFREDMETILKDTPAERQTIMFSATMPEDIAQLTKKFQKNPARIDVSCHKMNAPKIEQFYYELLEKSKPEALARLIDFYGVKLALVFCNTKMRVDELVEVLKTRGYLAEALHGDLNQRMRDKVMSGFRSGLIEILVATDVAGRGIDVNDVEAVFNYDLPRDDEDYVHRIGRTARAGKSGKAFTFVTSRQLSNLKRIERDFDLKVSCRRVPSLSDLDETRLKFYSEKIKEILAQGGLTKYVRIVENLIEEDYTTLDIAAALLRMALGDKIESNEEIEETGHQYRYDKQKDYKKNFGPRSDEDRYAKKPYKQHTSNESGERKFEDKKPGYKKFEGKKFEGKKFEKKPYEGKKFENKPYEGKKFEGKRDFGPRTEEAGTDAKPYKKYGSSDSGERKFEDKKSGYKKFEGKKFEKKPFEGKKFENKPFEGKKFEGKRDFGPRAEEAGTDAKPYKQYRSNESGEKKFEGKKPYKQYGPKKNGGKPSYFDKFKKGPKK